jgi:hypothetical protein
MQVLNPPKAVQLLSSDKYSSKSTDSALRTLPMEDITTHIWVPMSAILCWDVIPIAGGTAGGFWIVLGPSQAQQKLAVFGIIGVP